MAYIWTYGSTTTPNTRGARNRLIAFEFQSFLSKKISKLPWEAVLWRVQDGSCLLHSAQERAPLALLDSFSKARWVATADFPLASWGIREWVENQESKLVSEGEKGAEVWQISCSSHDYLQKRRPDHYNHVLCIPLYYVNMWLYLLRSMASRDQHLPVQDQYKLAACSNIFLPRLLNPVKGKGKRAWYIWCSTGCQHGLSHFSFIVYMLATRV